MLCSIKYYFMLILRQFSIFTKEKKCDCIRTDMTSGAEIIGSVDKISYFDFFLYLLHDIKRIFINRHTFTISQRYRQIECMDMVLYRDTKHDTYKAVTIKVAGTIMCCVVKKFCDFAQL